MKITDKTLTREYLEGKGYEEIELDYGIHFDEAVDKITDFYSYETVISKRYHLEKKIPMYLDYWGYTKKDGEYKKMLFNIKKEYRNVYDHVLDTYLEESRAKGVMPPKLENVIEALKFIAENHNNDNGIVVSKALIDYGFNFKNIDYIYKDRVMTKNGKRDANITTAIKIVERYRDSIFESRAIAKALLENDDEYSLYGFIRHLTGDETYTKEYADKVRAKSDIAKISGEALYEMFTGKTKAEYEEYSKKIEEDHITGKSDIMNSEELAESRAKGVMPVTRENVIAGLKYIAEHTKVGTYNRYEVADQLIELGYNFKLDDIKGQYDENGRYLEGMKKGELAAGVKTIELFRDSISASSYIEENLLADSDMSIYHYISVATGDESYTKEYVDSLKNVGKGK